MSVSVVVADKILKRQEEIVCVCEGQKMPERFKGVVKWFDNRKGYGFIQRDDVGDDVFVHFREIQGEGFKTLFEGQRVEFNLIERDKGFAAENVATTE